MSGKHYTFIDIVESLVVGAVCTEIIVRVFEAFTARWVHYKMCNQDVVYGNSCEEKKEADNQYPSKPAASSLKGVSIDDDYVIVSNAELTS